MNTYKNHKDDALTADWLRDNGLHDKTFATIKMEVVRAQTMTHTLLTQHRTLLTNKQLHQLTAFQQAAMNKRECKRITPAFCRCIMNINANINRQLFKHYRKLGRQSSAVSKG
jgi:hypothetical protein